jgi:hypothetical protein
MKLTFFTIVIVSLFLCTEVNSIPNFFKEKTTFQNKKASITTALAYYATKGAAAIATFGTTNLAILCIEAIGSFIIAPKTTCTDGVKFDYTPAIAAGTFAAIISTQSELVEKVACKAAIFFSTKPITASNSVILNTDIPFIP